MTFIDEIMGMDEGDARVDYRFTLFGKRGGYFECVKEVISFSSEEIIFTVGKRIFSVTGDNLYIIKYCGGDLCVGGFIRRWEIKSDA